MTTLPSDKIRRVVSCRLVANTANPVKKVDAEESEESLDFIWGRDAARCKASVGRGGRPHWNGRQNDGMMDKTLKVLNDLVRDGIIESYAIGGGVASLFYMEPVLTYDMDVFVFLPHGSGKVISLSPIYEHLRRKRYRPQKEQIVIEGIPVQFIPAYNDLVEEAVKESVQRRYKRIKTRILRAEHLVAIMLQTDRPKDRARMTQFLEQASINKGRLERILKRHGLWRRWHEFRRRFYAE